MGKKFWMYDLGVVGQEIKILLPYNDEDEEHVDEEEGVGAHQNIKDNLAQLGPINIRNGIVFEGSEDLQSTMVKNELWTGRVTAAESTHYAGDNIDETDFEFWIDPEDLPKLLEISAALAKQYSEELERVYRNYARSKGRTIEELDKEDKEKEGCEQPLGWDGPHRERANSTKFAIGSAAGGIHVGKLQKASGVA